MTEAAAALAPRVTVLLSGNEAVARGAWEAGVLVASAYPGTPSTEILENLAAMEGVSAEWAPNEKVAYETAFGGCLAGVRSLAAMKHVGVNVAADPLFTSVYTGVNGGLVLISADDPGMHSSQNEQDNRRYAPFARLPMLEPADSAEARDMATLAFQLSEDLGLPVMLRLTTRVSHSKSLVELGERRVPAPKAYRKDPAKYVMVPANARVRRVDLERRLERARAAAEASPLNRVEWASGSEYQAADATVSTVAAGARHLGVITAGIAYQYAREALGDGASYLKVGMTYPLPIERIREFAAQVDDVLIVEELDPYMEEAIAAAGVRPRSGRPAVGKAVLPAIGELSPARVRRGAQLAGFLPGLPDPVAARADAGETAVVPEADPAPALPDRPPVLCPGCPHRAAFWVLRRLGAVITGDIGCYTLGAAPPLSAMDSCICMGASITVGHGFAKAQERLRALHAVGEANEADATGGLAPSKPVIAVIGDSTFFHSGITGLMNVVYNQSDVVTVVLDNRTTGMTGHQPNPGTGVTLQGAGAPVLQPEDIARVLRVPFVEVVDPNDAAAFEDTLRRAMGSGGPAVVVARAPCVLLRSVKPKKPYRVDAAACNACRACTRIGCPAIMFTGTRVEIDRSLCRGCAACVALCRQNAIREEGVDL